MRINGICFDGTSSKAHAATVSRVGDNVILEINGESKTFARGNVKVISRLGSAPRVIEFPGHMRFETSYHDEVDRTFGGVSSLIHRLENDMTLVLISVVVFGFFCFASYMWIIPATAKFIVHKIPQSYIDELAKKTEGEWGIGKAVTLAQDEQDKLDVIITRLTTEFPEQKILIRPIEMELDMANAFALPDGTMMVTEPLLRLLSTDEALAVMMHEMGHVVNRHGLQALAGKVIISALMFVTLGSADFASLGQMMVGLSYSRASEKEADLFAAKHLRKINLKPTLLSDGLRKIEQSQRLGRSRSESKGPSFLSSHPLTEERAKYLREL